MIHGQNDGIEKVDYTQYAQCWCTHHIMHVFYMLFAIGLKYDWWHSIDGNWFSSVRNTVEHTGKRFDTHTQPSILLVFFFLFFILSSSLFVGIERTHTSAIDGTLMVHIIYSCASTNWRAFENISLPQTTRWLNKYSCML